MCKFLPELTLLALATLPLMAGCGRTPVRAAHQDVRAQARPLRPGTGYTADLFVFAAGPVATVNGQDIPARNFNDLARHQMDWLNVGSTPATYQLKMIRRLTLRQVTDRLLLSQYARKHPVRVPRAEMQHAYALFRGRFLNDRVFRAYLKHFRTTEAQARQELRKELTWNMVVARQLHVVVTDADARRYYNHNLRFYHHETEIQGREIGIVLSHGSNAAARKKVRKKMEAIAVAARKPGADFGKLARKYSQSPTRDHGGAFPYHKLSDFPAQVAAVLKHMKVGQISSPIVTTQACYIYKVTGRIPGVIIPFSTVKADLEEKLRAYRVALARKKLVVRLRRQAKIDIHEQNIRTRRRLPRRRRAARKTPASP